MYTFKIKKNYYGEKYNMFPKSSLNIDYGITVLVGCNGIGKSTLIQQMTEQLNKAGIEYVYYNNLVDGGDVAISRAIWTNKTDLAATALCSSEGERIVVNLSHVAFECGNYVKKNHAKPASLFFFFDAVDSGLSIDNIIMFKDKLLNIILKDTGNKAYIIIAANAYEMVKNQKCIDVCTFNLKKFETYDEYCDFVIKSSKYKDKICR